MASRVLVVDDDAHIRELCRLYLTHDGFVVDEAVDGQEALDAINGNAYDLVVLDLMMPQVDGFDVLSEVRQRDQWLPVVMLTAMGDEEDRILGLDMGADDYVIKPFSPKELVARVKAVLRRATAEPPARPSTVIRHPGLMIDVEKRTAHAGQEALSLTPREFDLLAFLASNPRQIFSRDVLLDRVWGFEFEGDSRTVDVHVTRLRQKLLATSTPYEYLDTVWGQGYRFQPKPRST
ncbi:response regulator transcription factor [Sulfobacillus harzensis]|uniref:Stage 0 sporulation protein A homolog n=1 Tax=Sulfobacillus harzensis TaxID=2729629 RepID=A0A7Y0L120_9FIRM|nr:response regulator transcription factor [Sulfobacillus harzensis]NMP21022.1 response regulator transcription factor [Sulfobacillus harzensis]